ncbi:hypothetical protein BT96DRAFT_812767 [Gymnopus androsaceus JB14]|uniref:Uncharacterized protein n=1 Tax=Gymnopus androsaceus JB14 TaxID=1447944 RepID=A0A6A4I3K9_9AGAR|nr:hypothetical protein BT96DRAFT_812767 [Gymnopus androsaceus JB14]
MLDVLEFIDNNGGNAEGVRESPRKRGHSVETVDEIIQMYNISIDRDLAGRYLVHRIPYFYCIRYGADP